MHVAASLKEFVKDAEGYGWEMGEENEIIKKFNWKKLIYNIRKYISDNNSFYESKLYELKIPYKNAFATLHDKNTVVFSEDKKDII